MEKHVNSGFFECCGLLQPIGVTFVRYDMRVVTNGTVLFVHIAQKIFRFFYLQRAQIACKLNSRFNKKSKFLGISVGKSNFYKIKEKTHCPGVMG